MAEASERSKQKLKVFVSYSRDDLEFADQLVAALDAFDFDLLIDRQGISAGEDWHRRLGALIAEADTVVFLLSPSALQSKMCAWEIAATDRLSKRLLPVVIKPLGATPVPERFQELNHIFFHAEPKLPGSGFGKGLAELVQALNTDLDWVREHTRLGLRAAEWRAGGQSESRLLSGGDIAAAKAWLARRPPKAPEPTPLHLDYIRASEDAQTARDSAARQRLEEVAAAQAARAAALADAERAQDERALALRRLGRRTLAGAAVAVVLALAAAALAWVAEVQRREAEVQRTIAVAQQLAAQGELALATGDRNAAEQGALLVVESLRRAPGTLLAQQGLASALAYFPPLAKELRYDDVPRGNSGAPLAFSPDGRYFAASGPDNVTRIWSIEAGERPVEIAQDHPIRAISFSDDSELLATAGLAPTVTLWRLPDGRPAGELEAGGDLQALAFGRQDGVLAAARGQGSDDIYIWNLGQTQRLKTLDHGTGDVVALQFSPDGRYLATAGWHRQIEENVTTIWDLQNDRPMARDNHLDGVAVAYSHDGQLLAAGGLDRRVEVWRITEPASDDPAHRSLAVAVLAETAADGLRSLAFSPDDRLLAIGGAELRLWDFRANRDVAAFEHEDVVEVAFVADGRYLASASLGTMRLWELRRGADLAEEIRVSRQPVPHAPLLALLPEICRRIGRELSHGEWNELLPTGAAPTVCAKE